MTTSSTATRSRLATPTAQASPPRPRSLLMFHLGTQVYALPLHEVAEIVPMAEFARPPNLPSVLAGFLNLGGSAIPVLRLDRLFEVPDVIGGRYTPLILLRNPDYRLALMVEKVSRVLTIAEDSVLPIGASHTFNDCVDGMVTLDGHVVLLLSAERILLEKEQQCLAEFQDREQLRLRALEEPGP